MDHFYQALTSGAKNEALPEEFNFFGKLIGSWNIDYVDNSTSKVMKGEWHFSWVLEGMAVQDVIVLPGFEYVDKLEFVTEIILNLKFSFSMWRFIDG